MNFQKFNVLLSELSNKKILITTHDHVDLDGFASCLLLKYFLETYIRTIDVHLFFSEISTYTINFVSKLRINFPDLVLLEKNDDDYLDIEFLIILDTNNLNQVVLPPNITGNRSIPFIFIDHHFESNADLIDNLIAHNIVVDEATSTAEIIFDIIKYYKIQIPVELRYLILGAIYSDTAGFKYANNATFLNISKLLNEILDYQQFLMFTEKKIDFSKKLAIIKGLKRVEIIRTNDWLIGLTHVSSYTSSVATAMLQIGFDVSVVYSKEPSNYRITTRAKKKVCLQTGLHLGRILSQIKEGSGGGHDGAASLNGESDFDLVLNQIVEKIKKTLNDT